MFCTENKQTRGGFRTPTSSMIKLFVTIEVISYWPSSSSLVDGWTVELPLYAIIFNFHDKIGSMGEDKEPEDWSISHTGIFFHFSVRGIQFFASSVEKRFLFDRTICILAFLQSVIWISTLSFGIFKYIVRVFKARKFFISEH